MFLWSRKRKLPSHLSVSGYCVSFEALRQRQSLLSAGPDVVEALRQEHHAGPSQLRALYQLLTSKEVGLFVWGRRHLTDCCHRVMCTGHPEWRTGCYYIQCRVEVKQVDSG